MDWKDEYDKYDLIDDTPEQINPNSALGALFGNMPYSGDKMFGNLGWNRGGEMDPGFYAQDPYPDMDRGFYANPPENPLEKFMKGGQAVGELFQGSQYPQYEFDDIDGTGYSMDPNNPMNLYPDNPDSPYYDPGPMDFDEEDPYWDSFA